ncbi:glycosyltransferase family 2 protein [Sulfurimonas sp. HSL1-6]|uniref:glycosyltransferase family 2 protein n=1 Tax=Thiomicrolovo immobilis TaxID=3131935 RepID=UPI0031F7617B
MKTNTQPKVAVVLLNYKGSEDTISCLHSLQKVTYPNYRVVVIDNDSPDDSMKQIQDYLQSQIPDDLVVFKSLDEAMSRSDSCAKYTLLQSGQNGGYGYGNNVGIQFALHNGADYVLILNNDIFIPDPGFIEPMVRLCEKDQTLGAVSGKIFFHDRPDIVWFNGGKLDPWTARVSHFGFNRLDGTENVLKDSTFLSGCMLLVPRKTIEIVGLFNEDYFMYVEDLEFVQRILNAGLSLKVTPLSRIEHKVGSSSNGRLSPFSIYYTHRNKIDFISRYIGYPQKVTAYTYTFVISPLRFIYKGRLDLFKAAIKGLFDGCRR